VFDRKASTAPEICGRGKGRYGGRIRHGEMILYLIARHPKMTTDEFDASKSD